MSDIHSPACQGRQCGCQEAMRAGQAAVFALCVHHSLWTLWQLRLQQPEPLAFQEWLVASIALSDPCCWHWLQDQPTEKAQEAELS